MYIVIGCWFYIIRPSVQTLFFALSPYFSLCLCHFELSLYCKASNNNNNNKNNSTLTSTEVRKKRLARPRVEGVVIFCCACA